MVSDTAKARGHGARISLVKSLPPVSGTEGMITNKIMKDIKGYEGLYKATEDGKIFSVRLGRYLKQYVYSGATAKQKYLAVGLPNIRSNRKTRNCYVHRLIAETFIPNPNNLKQIDHINHDKTDNNINNLRWCTIQQNHQNMPKGKKTSSKYKGVTFVKSSNRWIASGCYMRKVFYWGSYKTEKEAAEAYNRKAKELFGEFAFLNEIT